MSNVYALIGTSYGCCTQDELLMLSDDEEYLEECCKKLKSLKKTYIDDYEVQVWTKNIIHDMDIDEYIRKEKVASND